MIVLILGEVGAGSIGGGESVVVGFVKGLSALEPCGDNYIVLCGESMVSQLRPLAAPHIQILTRPKPKRTAGDIFKVVLGPLRRPFGQAWRWCLRRKEQTLPETMPVVDSYVQSIQHDVLHFAIPMHYATGGRNTVFGLYDLQHEHLQSIFGPEHIAYRRMLYDTVARDAKCIVSISRFTTHDFQKHHPCDPAKLYTVPLGPYVGEGSQQALSQQDEARLAELPTDFILYPAFSYLHKNHIKLLEGLSLAERDHGVRMPLVCTGGRSEHWQTVLEQWRKLSPRPALNDLAYTSRPLLQALFLRARYVTFPSLFEGQGLPLIEAARYGKSVACSDIPVFREFGGHGPVFFDANSPDQMADRLVELWLDETLRRESAAEISAVTANLTLENTALAMRAIYRKACGETLTTEDSQLLAKSL